MRKAFGKAAVALTATALAFNGVAFAGDYGCTTCYGPPSPPCAPACQPCQQPTTQHVHYHQKHCLFGHHHAPMMMPMTAPVVQVPMAAPVVATQAFAAQPVAFAAAPVAQSVAFAAPAATLAVPASFAFQAAPQAVSFAAPQTLSFAAPQAVSFGVANAANAQTAAPQAAAPNLNLTLAQVTQQADRAQAAASAAQAANLEVQTQLDALRTDVDALNAKFENLKACIANCIQNN